MIIGSRQILYSDGYTTGSDRSETEVGRSTVQSHVISHEQILAGNGTLPLQKETAADEEAIDVLECDLVKVYLG